MRERHIWPAVLALVGFAAVLAFSAAGFAQTTSVKMYKEGWKATDITAATGAAARYTGWIQVGDSRSLALEIAFDGSGAGTATKMSCWTHSDPTTANGSGFNIHITEASDTSGTINSYPLIWNYTTSATANWSWTVSNLPHDYVNCSLTVTSGDGSDLLTVKSRGISP